MEVCDWVRRVVILYLVIIHSRPSPEYAPLGVLTYTLYTPGVLTYMHLWGGTKGPNCPDLLRILPSRILLTTNIDGMQDSQLLIMFVAPPLPHPPP